MPTSWHEDRIEIIRHGYFTGKQIAINIDTILRSFGIIMANQCSQFVMSYKLHRV